MTTLRNPVTGHEVRTDDASVEFWLAAGYKAEAKRAPAKKSASPKKSGK